MSELEVITHSFVFNFILGIITSYRFAVTFSDIFDNIWKKYARAP